MDPASLTARNSPASGNVHIISPVGDLREPRASFSTTSVVSDTSSSSTVVTQHDLETCMSRMEERFESSMEHLTRNLVAPSKIDEITSRLDQLSVISPTQPLHGPYCTRMGRSMYTRPSPHLGSPLPAGYHQRFVEPYSQMHAPHTGHQAAAAPGPHVVTPVPVSSAPRFPACFVPDPSVRFQPATPPHLHHTDSVVHSAPAVTVSPGPHPVTTPSPNPAPDLCQASQASPYRPPPPAQSYEMPFLGIEPPIARDIFFSGRPSDLRDFLQDIRDAVRTFDD